MSIVLHAQKQHDAFFVSMARGGRWHLYRFPGTDRIVLMREDAHWDIEKPPVMVANVHAMTSSQLAARVQSIIRS